MNAHNENGLPNKAEAIQELLDAYETHKKEAVKLFGPNFSERRFSQWFTEQVMGRHHDK